MKRLALAVLALAATAQGDWPGPLEPQKLVTHLLARPCRVLDTRLPGCQAAVIWPPSVDPYVCPTGRMANGETRYLQFQAGARCQGTTTQPIPLGAKGLLVTLTAVEPTAEGHLVLYDPYPMTFETGPPPVSSLNFSAGQNAASAVTTALGQWQFQEPDIPFAPDTALTARVAGGGSVHVVVDVVGYLATAAP